VQVELGNKVRWKQGGAWMAQTIGGHGSVVGGEMLWSWSKVSGGVRRKLRTEDDLSRASR
jgi:hypothetical protein